MNRNIRSVNQSKIPFHPLANKYPLMEGLEFEAFKAGIQEAGMIRQPIVLYEGKILDGRNRYNAGTELGMPVPTRDFDPATEGDPEVFVRNLNDDRRHETQEAIRQRRQDRVQRVTEARREGDSLRTIAEKEGISLGQAQRDVREAQVYPGDTPEPKDGKVTGRDGKKYAAKPKPTPPPPPEREPGCDDEPPTDAIGLPIPEKLLPVFAARVLFAEARKLHRELTAKINEIASLEHVTAGRLRKELSRRERGGTAYWRSTDLESIKMLIDQWEPHVACCPWCLVENNGKPQKSCKACYGDGWVPLAIWKQSPREEREAVERTVQP
jgi:hypothetical protein